MQLGRLGAVTAVFVLVGVQAVQGQIGLPDLAVKAIRISPGSVESGESAQVRAVIVNQGQGDAGAFDVLFELNGRELGVRSMFELKSQQTRELQIPWQAVAGTHELIVSVDAPFNNVRESSESNNKRSLKFTVAPPAGVRSFSLDLIKTFVGALDEAGQALKFELTDNLFASINNAVRALQNSATALRNSSTEPQLARNGVPVLFANQPQYSEADALALLFDALAESLLRIGGTLSIGNFDGVLENAYNLRRGLVQLTGQKLASTSFASMQPAIEQFDRVIALATELRNLLKGAQGRPQYQVAVDLFNAFTAFGEHLRICSQEVLRQAHMRTARFSHSGDGQPLNGGYTIGRLLTIEMSGAFILQFELYNVSGALVYKGESIGSLEWDGTSDGATPVPAGMYFYRLTGLQKNGLARTELGRLKIVQAGEPGAASF